MFWSLVRPDRILPPITRSAAVTTSLEADEWAIGMITCECSRRRLLEFDRLIGTVGWYHGQPWPEVSRPVQVDQHEALPHGSCRWTTEDFAICCANHARQRAVMDG